MNLTDHARAAAYEGDFYAARYVLRWYADKQGWADETLRARWDGASALLGWWHKQGAPERPPLDDLNEADATAFLAALALQGLARTTVKGYRSGASALTQALRGAKSSPPAFDETYNPFRSVTPKLTKKLVPRVDPRRLKSMPPLPRARLELLLALLGHGMSVPEVCACLRRDLDVRHRFVLGYRGRCVTLGARAVGALERLDRLRPKRTGGFDRLLGWNADTARRWLNQVRDD